MSTTTTMTDNPTMIDKSTMIINERELNIFLHAVEMLRIHHLEVIGINKYDFNIANYDQERKKNYKYWEIVDEFIKKFSNYSIWW